ncbi:DUF305 domain-containing protein [Spiractinospora alimapuensis]|uniref:DUF305 domain-containing protein n=1 Tax=Spiractinospora alimapuensis TaxID=2820884 RepID=UPI001F3FA11B|nr:DUF305 domain-containing protein [Spiractinospora alimapuensis]QVQ51653.1 DUF305 domain-containing protein [Spiractinospora alimapuensis]
MPPDSYEGEADVTADASEEHDSHEDEEPEKSERTERSKPRTVPLVVVVVLVVAAALLGYLVGSPKNPLDNSADAGFARDMSVHHDQAVDMAMEVLPKIEDPGLRTVAYDMARTQQAQIGMMRGWLTQWDLPVRGGEPQMTWMAAHDHGLGPEGSVPETMPGYATEEQLDDLADASGVEAEILFLELMIPHHEGGVEMAEAAVALASEPYVVQLAEGMVVSQQSEIDMMESMLDERR